MRGGWCGSASAWREEGRKNVKEGREEGRKDRGKEGRKEARAPRKERWISNFQSLLVVHMPISVHHCALRHVPFFPHPTSTNNRQGDVTGLVAKKMVRKTGVVVSDIVVHMPISVHHYALRHIHKQQAGGRNGLGG
jgi:hypothetical protein